MCVWWWCSCIGLLEHLVLVLVLVLTAVPCMQRAAQRSRQHRQQTWAVYTIRRVWCNAGHQVLLGMTPERHKLRCVSQIMSPSHRVHLSDPQSKIPSHVAHQRPLRAVYMSVSIAPRQCLRKVAPGLHAHSEMVHALTRRLSLLLSWACHSVQNRASTCNLCSSTPVYWHAQVRRCWT
jgi:hypothetical protein